MKNPDLSARVSVFVQELLKHCTEEQYRCELQDALDSMLELLKSVNDSMHQIAITGYQVPTSQVNNYDRVDSHDTGCQIYDKSLGFTIKWSIRSFHHFEYLKHFYKVMNASLAGAVNLCYVFSVPGKPQPAGPSGDAGRLQRVDQP